MNKDDMIEALRRLLTERDDAVRLLAKVALGGNPTGPEWQRINELIRAEAR